MEDSQASSLKEQYSDPSNSHTKRRSILDNELFIERLETLYEKELTDLHAFAQREGCPFEEVRTLIAEWHCKALFDLSNTLAHSDSGKGRISGILRSISEVFESLYSIAGLHSFFLIVNPNDQLDEGFLGGTLLGREFWRGHRGCGSTGARAFQAYCQKPSTQILQPQVAPNALATGTTIQSASPPASKKGPASSVKAQVYASVRDAIRVASGVRNAEMKWTNHSKLDNYGIHVVGWPSDVPMQNPSSLSTAQNKLILDALMHGDLRFLPLDTNASFNTTGISEQQSRPQNDDTDVFASAVDFFWAEDRPETFVSGAVNIASGSEPPIPLVSVPVTRQDCLDFGRETSQNEPPCSVIPANFSPSPGKYDPMESGSDDIEGGGGSSRKRKRESYVDSNNL